MELIMINKILKHIRKIRKILNIVNDAFLLFFTTKQFKEGLKDFYYFKLKQINGDPSNTQYTKTDRYLDNSIIIEEIKADISKISYYSKIIKDKHENMDYTDKNIDIAHTLNKQVLLISEKLEHKLGVEKSCNVTHKTYKGTYRRPFDM